MSKDKTKIVSTDFIETTLQALHSELEENKYVLPTASTTLGGVKTTSTVTSNSGYTACPIISGVPYYKDTNTNNYVLQSNNTTSNYRPLLLGYTNVTDTTKLNATVTNQAYVNNYLYVQPSTGTIFANLFNGNLNGNATSATLATKATNADKAATATTLTGLTSTITELNYCKGVTSSIQTQLNNRIINNVFIGGGITGTNGYVAFAQLQVASGYINRPIEFELICRGRNTPCYVHLMFANTSSNDPNIEALTYWGTSYGVFAHKIGTSTWLLYYTKSESYDTVTVAKVQAGAQNIAITYPGTFITEKPTENVIDAVIGGHIGNTLKLNGYSLSTAGMKNVWGTVPSIGADGVMEVGKYIDFHSVSNSASDYDVRITANTSGLTLSGTTSGTFSGNLSGNATSSTSASKLSLQSIATNCNTGGLYIINTSGLAVGNSNDFSVETPNTYSSVQYGTTLRIKYGNTTPYYTDIFTNANSSSLLYKTVVNGTAKGWKQILDSGNCSSYVLPLSGGTLTIPTYYGLTLKRSDANGAAISYQNTNGALGGAGFLTNGSFQISSGTNTSGDIMLASTSNVKFPNTVTAKMFSGILSGNASTATKLEASRTIQTNLSSTTFASFDGTSNITPGVTGVLSLANGGTGQTSANLSANVFMNALSIGESVPQDADYFISQYVGGGTTYTSYHRRPISALWSYIKSKTDSVYSLNSHTHSYLPLSGGTVKGSLILNTDTGNAPLKITRMGSDREHTAIYQNDIGLILDVTNDETSSNIIINMKATDTESSDGSKANANTVKITSTSTGSNIIATTFSGALSGNASTATKLATARTIALTGSITGSGSFDGSGNLSISTTTNHSHNYLTVKGSNTITTTTDDTTAKWGAHQSSVHWYSTTGQLIDQPSQWGYLLNIGQGSEVHQLWLQQSSGSISHRGGNGNGWDGTWKTLLDSSNYSSYALPKSGGTLTGAVTIQSNGLNGTYNGLLVGDDCYIGDCNIANTIGLMGVSNNNLAYIKFGKSGGQLGFNGSNLVYGGSIVLTENTGTALAAKGLKSTGFGNTNFTYFQTDQSFNGRSGWAHYLIGNHGDGASQYHYAIALPFWGSPIYKRQWDGGNSGWHNFFTTENITYGTSALIAGSSNLATGNIYLQYE